MNEPTPDDVEQIVRQAQQLEDIKQKLIDDLRARGEDPDDVRVIVGHRTENGDYVATEVLTPAWMRETPPDA